MVNVDAGEVGLVDSEQKALLEVFGFEFKQRKSYDEYRCTIHSVETDVTLDDVMMLSDYFTVTIANSTVYIKG